MTSFWQKDQETLPLGELRALQLERLQRTLSRVTELNPFYRERFSRAGFSIASLKTLDDLRRLPFTIKDDIRDHYPFGLFSAPLKQVVRVHASSGTTGKPTVVGYTKNDLEMWSDLVARLAVAVGATPDDIAQVAFGYGLFTGAFGLHYGLERLGATIIPASSGNSEKQVMLMKDLGATILVSTPSYALHLGEVAADMGIKPGDLKLRLGLFGAEGCGDEMRSAIEKSLGLFATDNYGMSELLGPGVSGECLHRCGLHINEDHFIAEIIHPETLEVLGEGERGELVVTSLTKEAFPVIRYRTRDITSLTYEPCKCGRTFARMAKVTGRSDDMLIIKGVNVFPSQVESALAGMAHIGPQYRLVIRNEGNHATLEVEVELADSSLLDHYAELEKLTADARHRVRTVLGLDVKVRLVAARTLERTAGKSKRVIDLRNEGSVKS